MTMSSDPNDQVSRPGDGRDHVPFESEPLPVEAAPRRAASAQFIVDSDVGSEAAMRDAMDPANRSLAEALRLSYRVLQVVILVLVVLFIFSGWKSVQEGQTGVLTVWGKIAEVGGSKALTPGLKFSKWPYPAGEFILFQEQNRAVDLGSAFWPAMRPGADFKDMLQQASVNDRLKPGRDGSLITRDGELAHLQINVRYAIADPVAFVSDVRIEREAVDRLVELALQRSVVQAGARLTVDELVEKGDRLAGLIERNAQHLLDAVASGIRLQSVDLPNTSSPLAVRKTLEDVQLAKTQVLQGLVEGASESRRDAHRRGGG